MAKIRVDDNLVVQVEFQAGALFRVVLYYAEEVDDGTYAPVTVGKTTTLDPSDIAPGNQTALSTLIANLKSDRDTKDPIT